MIEDPLLAQRYNGYGRGSDYTGSEGDPMLILYFILLVFASFVIFFIYHVIKSKYGKKEWSYSEFSCKHGPKVQQIKDSKDVFIETLVFSTPSGKRTFAKLDWSCRNEYYDVDNVDIDKGNLFIKLSEDQYIMYKNKGKK